LWRNLDLLEKIDVGLKVFISYAREDREKALHYYDLFAREGVFPWIDIKNLLPGQNWDTEISRALSEANLVVLLLSPRSVNKRGFVQREANEAIDRLRYKQPTDIYVIPLLLEPCEVPTQIAGRLQYVDLSTDGAWEQVRAALRVASEQQSIQLEHGVVFGPFSVFTDRIQETWEALPGHEIEIEYPRFESTRKQSIARELSAIFRGRAFRTLVEERQKPWDQSPDLFQGPFSATAANGRWEGYGLVHATDRLLSLTYEGGYYGAGAAHPNMFFETFTFAYPERLCLLNLQDFFVDCDAAAQRISAICIHGLSREYWERTGEKPGEEQLSWFKAGAGGKLENFAAFTVADDRFTFLFPPYQVGAYALGRWAADVPIYDLLDLLKPEGPHTFALPEGLC